MVIMSDGDTSSSDQVTHSHSAADLGSIKSIPTKDGT